MSRCLYICVVQKNLLSSSSTLYFSRAVTTKWLIVSPAVYDRCCLLYIRTILRYHPTVWFGLESKHSACRHQTDLRRTSLPLLSFLTHQKRKRSEGDLIAATVTTSQRRPTVSSGWCRSSGVHRLLLLLLFVSVLGNLWRAVEGLLPLAPDQKVQAADHKH